MNVVFQASGLSLTYDCMIRVLLFAGAKSLAGREALEVSLDRATIAELQAAVLAECPTLQPLLVRSLWAVDGEYAKAETIVTTKSEVALIPPVSGG
jgi:molybdopterin converting factor small subunit